MRQCASDALGFFGAKVMMVHTVAKSSANLVGSSGNLSGKVYSSRAWRTVHRYRLTVQPGSVSAPVAQFAAVAYGTN
jgi:hypothetical protein